MNSEIRMANGETAFHMASLVNNLTNTLTVLTSGKADFNSEQSAKQILILGYNPMFHSSQTSRIKIDPQSKHICC